MQSRCASRAAPNYLPWLSSFCRNGTMLYALVLIDVNSSSSTGKCLFINFFLIPKCPHQGRLFVPIFREERVWLHRFLFYVFLKLCWQSLKKWKEGHEKNKEQKKKKKRGTRRMTFSRSSLDFNQAQPLFRCRLWLAVRLSQFEFPLLTRTERTHDASPPSPFFFLSCNNFTFVALWLWFFFSRL